MQDDGSTTSGAEEVDWDEPGELVMAPELLAMYRAWFMAPARLVLADELSPLDRLIGLIVRLYRDRGDPITVRALAEHTGASTRAVNASLARLRKDDHV